MPILHCTGKTCERCRVEKSKVLALKWQKGQRAGAREMREQMAGGGAYHQKGQRVSEIEKHYILCLKAKGGD